jgi:hypothetical protein
MCAPLSAVCSQNRLTLAVEKCSADLFCGSAAFPRPSGTSRGPNPNTVHISGLRKLFINLFRRDPLTPTTRKTWGPLRLAVPPLPQRGEGRRILSREEEFIVLVLHS